MAGGRINPRPLMSSSAIRQRFLDFFAARGHTHVPSSPVVLPSASRDDSIAELFVNAGMVQV
jgi:alanyl-tRNA synthetase